MRLRGIDENVYLPLRYGVLRFVNHDDSHFPCGLGGNPIKPPRTCMIRGESVMAKIIRFPKEAAGPGKRSRQRENETEAEIILFPGVRYEYLDVKEGGAENASEAREHG